MLEFQKASEDRDYETLLTKVKKYDNIASSAFVVSLQTINWESVTRKQGELLKTYQ